MATDGDLFATQPIQQTKCPLFNKLPAELRAQIFVYVLTDYADHASEKKYTETTCYTRPDYFAPRRSDTALLRTCRAVYCESWFLPFQLREQVHWLAENNRRPPEYSIDQQQTYVIRNRRLYALRNGGDGRHEIQCMRVFAQMYRLEGGEFVNLITQHGILPRQLILTIRHADWWNWEVDRPLYFSAGWIHEIAPHLPDCVREFRIDIETVSRRKAQLVEIAKQMSEKWFIKRQDGTVLYPDVTRQLMTESNWVGPSEWHDQRWVRDEFTEGKINFVVLSIPFRMEHVITRAGGQISDTARRMAESTQVDSKEMELFYGTVRPEQHQYPMRPTIGDDYLVRRPGGVRPAHGRFEILRRTRNRT